MIAFPPDFFSRDPLEVAPALLGSLLVRFHAEQGELVGRIVETEAYRGEEDQACHAKAGPTRRTATLYGPPGRAYVYLIYGMYHMLNVVTWPEGRPSAVLIRALEPVRGLEGGTDGPGKLCRAMEITRALDGGDLSAPPLLLAPGEPVAPSKVGTSPRIGVGYAGDWAQKPWRYFVRENAWVSRDPSRRAQRR